MYTFFIKRVFDFTISLFLFVLLSPILFVIGIILILKYNESPFFFQIRPGKNTTLFKLIKFKTMHNQKDAWGNLLPDKERFTPFGLFLRRTSLDEIPQLINVIKGDMSLVGPRPLLVEYLPLYSSMQARRHEVLPGITGWAQVNGRNTISWDQKFEYDIWYVNHIGFIIDIKILFLTFLKVIRREGVNSSALVTMEKFTGNQSL